MTKIEMLAFLDAAIAELRQRWRVATVTTTKARMKKDGERLVAIRDALERHVPADQASATQAPLFHESQNRG